MAIFIPRERLLNLIPEPNRKDFNLDSLTDYLSLMITTGAQTITTGQVEISPELSRLSRELSDAGIKLDQLTLLGWEILLNSPKDK